jgi:hypothetical protein
MTYARTLEQLQQSSLLQVLSLISPHGVKGQDKRRIGGDFDGGYVVLSDARKTSVCYSLGIGSNVTFDTAIADMGAVVYQYDHTIDAPPTQHENFRFFKLGIAPSDERDPLLRRLDTLIKLNGHESARDMLLKMDIEGNEWSCLDATASEVIDQFSQIVCEFHDMERMADPEFAEPVARVFEKLYRTHRVVHAHGNNHLPFVELWGVPVPRVFELTFANIRSFEFDKSIESFPTALDQPCNPLLPDLFLGSFQFGAPRATEMHVSA